MAGEILVKDTSKFPIHPPSRFGNFPSNPHNWTPEQVADFGAWFVKLGDGARVRTTSPSVVWHWNRAMLDLELAVEEARDKPEQA
jgi:hypothetical protein